jgi:hypothetical protein
MNPFDESVGPYPNSFQARPTHAFQPWSGLDWRELEVGAVARNRANWLVLLFNLELIQLVA